MLNIVIPPKKAKEITNTVIQKLIKKIGPTDCEICQLQKGLHEMDLLIGNDLDVGDLM